VKKKVSAEAPERNHVKVRRHGKVHELPADIRKSVDNLLVEPGIGYEDIAEYLKQKGHDVSKSSIGRYGKDFLAAYQRLRIIEDQSRALISDAGGDGLILEEAGSKLAAKKMIELLLSDDVGIKKIGDIAQGIASLQRASVAREKFKQDLKEKLQKTAEAVNKIVKSSGLSDKAAAEIRAKILGIA
jgi:hypothetical protein